MGMRICVCSVSEKENRLNQQNGKGHESFLTADLAGWKRGGYDINYKSSKLNALIEKSLLDDGHAPNSDVVLNHPRFYQLSFTYDFNLMVQDDTYFAYSFPYTFTRLSNFIKEIKSDPQVMDYTKDCTPLCSSLSGIDVPYLTITSRVHEDNFEKIMESEHGQG